MTAIGTLLCSCTEDEPGQPPVGSASYTAGGGTGGDGGDDDGGDDGEADDGADETGGEMCVPEIVTWYCNMQCFVIYSAPGQSDTMNPDGSGNGPRGCLAPGNVAGEDAVDMDDTLGGVCSTAASSPPEALCTLGEDQGASGLEDDAEAWAATHGILPMHIDDAPGQVVHNGITWTAHVECYHYGDTPNEWNNEAMGICEGVSAQDIAFVSGDPCSMDDCALLAPYCEDYVLLGDAEIDHTVGNTIYSTVDLDWVDDVVRGNTGLLYICDLGRYSLSAQEFFNLNSASFWRAIGVLNEDEDLRVWAHDPITYDRVGSAYDINDAEDGLAAFNALIEDEGDPLHITLSVKRNGVTKKIHVDGI